MFAVFKTFTRQRLVSITLAFGFEAIWFAVIMIWSSVRHRFTTGDAAGMLGVYAIIMSLAIFVELAMFNERIWLRDYYRQVPIGGARLQLATLLANFLAVLYFMAAQVLAIALAVVINGSPITHSDLDWASGVLAVIMLLCAYWYGWSLITCIHLVTQSLLATLPAIRGWVLKAGLYTVSIAVTLVSLRVLGQVVQHLAPAVSASVHFAFGAGNNVNISLGVIGNATVMFAVMAIALLALNSYLLNRVVATTPTFEA